MNQRTSLVVAVVLALMTSAVPSTIAAEPRDALLITVDALARRLDEPGLVLLHVGDKAGYEAGHLPGARHVMLTDISRSFRETGGPSLEMLPADALRDRLAAFGISDESLVVVYVAKDWVSPATRVVFTLDYAGLGERVRLLDGGQPAWVAAGHRVTTDVPPARTGTLSPLKTRPLVVDAQYVLSHRSVAGVSVVDARNAEFYDGSHAGGAAGRSHRPGHIQGARSLPFGEVFDDDLRLRPQDELRALFARAGIGPGDTVIAYCHIGQQATAVLFAARALGHAVLLYDGSFEDWSPQFGLPVEGPPPAAPR